jgi:hypothetical protein
MRLVAVLLVLLAGCIAPETEPTRELLGYCPQWVPGPGQFAGSVEVDAEARDASVEISPELRNGGRPLDVYRLRLDRLEVEGGVLEVRAHVLNSTAPGRNFFDYRQVAFRSVPFLVLAKAEDVGAEFDVVLSPVSHGETVESKALRLDWTFVGASGKASAEYTVRFLYRVCGAPV